MDIRKKELENAKDRVHHLQSNFINNEKLDFYEYLKKNEYKTMWDAKKNNPTLSNPNAGIMSNIFTNVYNNSNNSGRAQNAQYGGMMQNQMSQKI